MSAKNKNQKIKPSSPSTISTSPEGQKVQLSKNSKYILERRYLKKDEHGKVLETPEDLFCRVAKNIALVDLNYDKQADIDNVARRFYNLMANLEFLPNSPTLMNAGQELQQLSACFVLPIEDSMESIFETLKYAALIHKSGGGTGFSFSRLRPKNDAVKSTQGIASGPVSFMAVFDAATEIVKQGGTRRGANMGILRADHPDIIEFISCKEHEGALNNFNISVALTEEFMRHVREGKDYPLINPRNNTTTKWLNARDVFSLIIKMAWQNGDPGIIFLDRINKTNPTPAIGEIESTNPCGEQPLLAYESCNLGSINLAKMITYKGKKAVINYHRIRTIIPDCIHFLDNIIDANRYPLEQIETITKANRKIGLGVMGFADALIALEIPYNSDQALKLGEEIMKFIEREAKKTSQVLAKKRGAFPNFPRSIYADRNEPPQRNATVTTIAPTGTISLIADCSSGIEPIFAVAYSRHHTLGNEPLQIVHPLFESVAHEKGFYSKQLIQTVIHQGNLDSVETVPENVRKLFVTAHDIAPEWHIRMQSAFQKYTDNAVSKTVNFPKDATPNDIEKVYMLAYELGCKGVTVYRDQSRHRQVLSLTLQKPETFIKKPLMPRERPRVTEGITEKITTSDGTLYVTINHDDYGLCEVFTRIGKHGSDVASWSEAVGRLISLCLRSGISLKSIIDQLIGITSKPIWHDGELILSVPDAIGRTLAGYIKKYGKEEQLSLSFTEQVSSHQPVGSQSSKMIDALTLRCPECGNVLEKESGCVVCRFCGFTQCG